MPAAILIPAVMSLPNARRRYRPGRSSSGIRSSGSCSICRGRIGGRDCSTRPLAAWITTTNPGAIGRPLGHGDAPGRCLAYDPAPRHQMKVKIGCHTFRATDITAYLEAGGTLENAQLMAAHESPRTTKLYDRTGDEITLDEVERIAI
jgi:hypothetical protein